MNLERFFLFFLLGLITSCQSPDRSTEDAPMQFQVDSSLLAEEVSIDGYNIRYRPPLEWRAIDGDCFYQRMAGHFNRQAGILKVHEDSASSAFLVVSDVRAEDPGMNDPLIKKDDEKKGRNVPWQDVRKGTFRHNDLQFTQYLLQGPRWISFRLFAEAADQSLRFDYFVRREIYGKEIKNIESSIGSINQSITNQ